MSERPLVSVVIPCFNEEACLPALFAELEALFESKREVRFEVVAVDDGSRDGTLRVLREKAATSGYLTLVSLSRNFGSHAALLAGLRAARGEAVTFLAADLQDPPELIGRLVDSWREGHEVVWALKTGRQDSFLVRFNSRVAHRLFAWLTGMDVPSEGLEIFLADRRAVDAVCAARWRNCSVIMAFYWAGFPSATVTYEKRARSQGASKWTFRKRLRLFVDATVGFSYLPMRLMSLFGGLIALSGFIYAIFIMVNRLFLGGEAIQGWASLMVVVLVMGGVLLLSNGVLGEYVWRTLEESRQRPMYLVREVVTPRGDDDSAPPEAIPAAES